MTRRNPPGPVKADFDLRTMLRNHLATRAVNALDQTAARRRKSLESQDSLAAWQSNIRRDAETLLELGTDLHNPLNARIVASRQCDGFSIENVIFESISAWQVNATLFIPQHLGGPYLPVVVPCGHSAKTGPAYQLVCQVLAKAGYLAITFDAPGQGEKQQGNDHFVDGVRSVAVGQSAQRYFVADALAAINYLSTRPDVDQRSGFAITGVSGGAITAMHAAVVDSRITAVGLVCGPVAMREHPIGDGYAICPEKLSLDRLQHGIDDIDMMAAIAPRPLMFMAGKRDPVMQPAATEPVISEVADAYAAAGASGKFQGAMLDVEHDYTPDMARRFVDFLDKHFAPSQPARSSDYQNEPRLLPAEAMHCHPAAEPNMHTLAAGRAEQMRMRRPKLRGRSDAARVVAELAGLPAQLDDIPMPVATGNDATRAWNADLQELLLTYDNGIALPATMFRPRNAAAPGAVVVFDDRGRWAPIQNNGWAAKVAGAFDASSGQAHPIVLSVDLRGWGDTYPAATTYDIAGWAGRDRWPNYLANALGDSLMAQRVRDGLAATLWLQQTTRLTDDKLAFAGRGIGSIVALMVGCMFEHARAVVAIDGPHSVQDAINQPRVAWDLSIFMPRLLDHADLYELADAFGPVYQVRPRDGEYRQTNDRTDQHAADWLLARFNPA